MLQSLKDLFGAFTAPAEAPPQARTRALQLAMTVLLVEVMRVDPATKPAERSAVLENLREWFPLADDALAQLMSRAEQTAKTASDYFQFTSCINCALCYAACPQFGLNHDFIGPGMMALVQRYNLDSRDSASAQRMELVASEKEGVYHCSAVGYCSEVCPKHVDPASAVNINKANAAKDYFLRFLSPKGGSK